MEFDAASGKYSMNAEQALCLADPNGPVDLPGAYAIVQDLFHVRQRALENFRSGNGMEWGEHHPCLFHGTERFFRAGYNANLLGAWLPALDGVVAKLNAGANAADVGCGHGASTILMAKAFPSSQFIGIDYHEASIETARKRAAEAGVSNAKFEVADAVSYSASGLDFIAFFDCLHDMADPVGRRTPRSQRAQARWQLHDCRAIRGRQCGRQPEPGGTRVLWRVFAHLRARITGKAWTGVGSAGRRKTLRDVVVEQGGFTRFRRATETPFNIVLEARP